MINCAFSWRSFGSKEPMPFWRLVWFGRERVERIWTLVIAREVRFVRRIWFRFIAGHRSDRWAIVDDRSKESQVIALVMSRKSTRIRRDQRIKVGPRLELHIKAWVRSLWKKFKIWSGSRVRSNLKGKVDFCFIKERANEIGVYLMWAACSAGRTNGQDLGVVAT